MGWLYPAGSQARYAAGVEGFVKTSSSFVFKYIRSSLLSIPVPGGRVDKRVNRVHTNPVFALIEVV